MVSLIQTRMHKSTNGKKRSLNQLQSKTDQGINNNIPCRMLLYYTDELCTWKMWDSLPVAKRNLIPTIQVTAYLLRREEISSSAVK